MLRYVRHWDLAFSVPDHCMPYRYRFLIRWYHRIYICNNDDDANELSLRFITLPQLLEQAYCFTNMIFIYVMGRLVFAMITFCLGVQILLFFGFRFCKFDIYNECFIYLRYFSDKSKGSIGASKVIIYSYFA